MGFYRKRPQSSLKTGVTTLLCGILGAGGLTLMSPAASGLLVPAQADSAPISPIKTVSLDVANEDFHTVIGMVQRSTGMEIIVQDGDKPFKPVSVYLKDSTFEKALRSIAFSAGATVTTNSDGVYVFQPAASVSTSNYSNGDATLQTVPYQELAPAPAPVATPSNMTWHKLELRYAVPSEILQIMHWDRDLRQIDPYGGQANRLAPSIITPGSSLNMDAMDYSSPSVPIGRGDSGMADQANRSVVPDMQAQQFRRGGGGQPGGGFGGQPGGGFGGQPGGGVNPFQQGGVTGGANGNGQEQLPDGVDKIYALEGDNSLFIQATPDGFQRVRDIVKNLDISPRQVQIKVEFVTATVSDVDAFGINFSLVPLPGVAVSNNQGTAASTSPQTYVQVASGNIVAEMFSTLTQGRGKTVQSPLITTTNNVPAFINVANQIPYVTTTNVVGGAGGNVISNTQQNFLTINTGLQVTPRINSDDSVTLRLVPVISDTNGLPAIAGGAPPITSQTLQTLRTVQNGETMVLGGLVRKADSVQLNRIPFFGDLPLIGFLFRSHVKNNSDSELLIFVTPTIIGESSEGPGTSAGSNVSVAP